MSKHPQIKHYLTEELGYTCAGCGRDFDTARLIPATAQGDLVCGRPGCWDRGQYWCDNHGGHLVTAPAAVESNKGSWRMYRCPGPPPAPPRKATCQRCGSDFAPLRRSDARYCSGACRVAAHRAAKRTADG